MIQTLISGVDIVARETTMFAAIWFMFGGVDDLAVDLIFLRIRRRRDCRTLDDFPVASCTGRLAIFVPAWSEAAVIGQMLSTALARIEHPAYRVYVGLYPNDQATIDAVSPIARADVRVRMVVGDRPGPTTKADCLNRLWEQLARDDAAEGVATTGIVLHDAEDVVHRGELRLIDHFLTDHDAVQIPVLPLVDRTSRMISGHYCDEFAEAHARQLVVRSRIGAAMPLAGTGCGIRREVLAAIARSRGGHPFDETSLTEDYELGLLIAERGGRACLLRIRERAGAGRDAGLVAVRAFFPGSLNLAIRQKARWMAGIALVGWDRVGWAKGASLADHWMRMRDRRGTLAALVLASAYLALAMWGLSLLGHGLFGGKPAAPAGWVQGVLTVNAFLLVWRLGGRAVLVGAAYGPVEAALSFPRTLVANAISLLAARRALAMYLGSLLGRPLRWDKTPHHFPNAVADSG